MHSRTWVFALLAVIVAAGASGCSRDRNDANAEVGPARHVHTTRLHAADRTEVLRLIGSVEPIHDVTISAVVPGRIISQLHDVGDEVAAGDVLFQLDDARFQLAVDQAAAELERLEATLVQRNRDLERAQNLFNDGVSSEDVLEAARTEVHVTEAAVRGQRARLDSLKRDLMDSTIRSAVAGQVVERMVDVGELVGAGTPLIRIVDTSRIKIVTRINEMDLAKVRVGVVGTVRLDAYADGALTAPVTAISTQADRATRTFPIELAMNNRPVDPLRAGMVARVELPGDRFPDAIAFRQDAVVERAGRQLAYVVQPDGTVEERELTLGKVFGTDVIVLGGLQPGDEVVTRGQFTLQHGDAVQVVEATS